MPGDELSLHHAARSVKPFASGALYWLGAQKYCPDMQLLLLRIALAAIFIAILGWAVHGRLDIQGHGAHLLWGTLAVIPFTIVCLALVAFNLSILSGGSVGYRHAFRAASLVTPLFLMLPSRLSELVKPLYLMSAAKLPLAKGVAVVAVERFLDVVCVAALIAVAATLAVPGSAGALQFSAILFASVAAAGLCGIVVLLTIPEWIIEFSAGFRLDGLRRNAQALFLATRETVSPRRLAGALIVGVLTWASSYASFWTFLNIAGQHPLSWSAVLQVFVLGRSVLPWPWHLEVWDVRGRRDGRSVGARLPLSEEEQSWPSRSVWPTSCHRLWLYCDGSARRGKSGGSDQTHAGRDRCLVTLATHRGCTKHEAPLSDV